MELGSILTLMLSYLREILDLGLFAAADLCKKKKKKKYFYIVQMFSGNYS